MCVTSLGKSTFERDISIKTSDDKLPFHPKALIVRVEFSLFIYQEVFALDIHPDKLEEGDRFEKLGHLYCKLVEEVSG